MSALEVVAFSAVLAMGVLVVLTQSPFKQVFVNSLFGLTLIVLFVVLQAPDVALSELVVGSVAFPLILLATLAKVRGKEEGD